MVAAGTLQAGRGQASAGVFSRWCRYTIAGEFAGFSVPGLLGAVMAAVSAPDTVFVPAMVGAGALEGAVLGFAQSRVLRSTIPRFDPGRWIRLTATGAAIAWAIGMIPGSQQDRLHELPSWLLAFAATLLAIVFLVTIGGSQWLELRRNVERAAWWIPANALAWTIGVNLVVAAMSVVPNDASPAVFAAAGLCGGLAMAVAVAAVTGKTLEWLLEGSRMARAQGLGKETASTT